MAEVRKVRDARDQIIAYGRLQRLRRLFATWHVLEWNDAAVDEFERPRGVRIQIGTMDLKIASAALANNATLLTRNSRDFEQVPGLRIENWLS